MQRIEQGFLTLISASTNLFDKLYIFSLLRFFKKNSVIILMYHGITASNNPVANFNHKHVEKEKFEKQLKYLQKYYSIISLQDFMLWRQGKKTFPKPLLMLTFDDGYKNCYTQLFPILKKYNIPATIFLPTNYVGTKEPAWYDTIAWCITETKKQSLMLYGEEYPLENQKQKKALLVQLKRLEKENLQGTVKKVIGELIKQTGCDPKKCMSEDFLFMSWKECREMQQNNITFGSHSTTHRRMIILAENEIKKEVSQSKKAIETNLKKPCIAFAYPFGSNNRTIRKILAEEGYVYAFTSTYGANTKKTNPLALKRIALNNLYDLNIFKLTLFVNFPVFHHWLLCLYSKMRK